MLSLGKGKKSKSTIGLDVGARGLRAAQVVSSGDKWTVVGLSCGERARGDLEDVLSPPMSLVQTVTTRERFRTRRTVASLSSPDIDYFALEIPPGVVAAGHERLGEVVGVEVSRLMGGCDGGSVSAAWECPRGSGSSPNHLGVGASSDSVRRLLKSLDNAKLDCTAVEPAGLGLARMGALLRGVSDEELWGVLDIGDRQARVVLCVGEVPVLARTVGVGVGGWRDQVAEALGVSTKSADVHLRDNGLVSADRQRGSVSGLITGALRSQLRETVTEIGRSLSYVHQCYPGHDFGGFILVGGGGVIPNVGSYFANALNTTVQSASALLPSDTCKLTFTTGHPQRLELMAVAIGAAISA